MARQTITLLSDEQAQAIATAAYAETVATYRQASGADCGAWEAARYAVFASYPVDTFCVARETPVHKAIRKQAREAANAASAANRQ